MKNPAKRAIIFLLITLIIAMGLTFSAQAMQTSKTKSGGKTLLGWCCENGKIFHVSQSFCQTRKGHFFKEKTAAEAWLDAQTPGFCCLNDKVSTSKKGDCLKKKGHFFEKNDVAVSWCDLHQTGFCCLGGKMVSSLKKDCLKKKRHFFKGKTAANRYCDLHQPGWCVLKGRAFASIKQACLNKKGRFFTRKAEADKAARTVSADAATHGSKGHKPAAIPAVIGATAFNHKARPLLTVEKVYLKKVEDN